MENQPENKPFEKRGFHNWRNLFKKPNGYEVTILLMLIVGGIAALAYQHDTKVCRDFVKNLPVVACQICNAQVKNATNQVGQSEPLLNPSFFSNNSGGATNGS